LKNRVTWDNENIKEESKYIIGKNITNIPLKSLNIEELSNNETDITDIPLESVSINNDIILEDEKSDEVNIKSTKNDIILEDEKYNDADINSINNVQINNTSLFNKKGGAEISGIGSNNNDFITQNKVDKIPPKLDLIGNILSSNSNIKNINIKINKQKAPEFVSEKNNMDLGKIDLINVLDKNNIEENNEMEGVVVTDNESIGQNINFLNILDTENNSKLI